MDGPVVRRAGGRTDERDKGQESLCATVWRHSQRFEYKIRIFGCVGPAGRANQYTSLLLLVESCDDDDEDDVITGKKNQRGETAEKTRRDRKWWRQSKCRRRRSGSSRGAGMPVLLPSKVSVWLRVIARQRRRRRRRRRLVFGLANRFRSVLQPSIRKYGPCQTPLSSYSALSYLDLPAQQQMTVVEASSSTSSQQWSTTTTTLVWAHSRQHSRLKRNWQMTPQLGDDKDVQKSPVPVGQQHSGRLKERLSLFLVQQSARIRSSWENVKKSRNWDVVGGGREEKRRDPTQCTHAHNTPARAHTSPNTQQLWPASRHRLSTESAVLSTDPPTATPAE